MKSTISHLFICASVAVLLGLASCAGGDKSDATLSTKTSDSEEKEHLVGAYTDFRPVEEEDVLVFNEARDNYIAGGQGSEELIARLKAFVPTEVSTQVVAGLNYIFRNDVNPDMVIKVFRPLPGQGEPQIMAP